MSLKRPPPRPPRGPAPPFVRPTEGVVHDILNLSQYVYPTSRPTVYQDRSDEYIRLLKMNYEHWGVPFRAPNVAELPPKHKELCDPESRISYLDQVQVRLNVLKNGKVRVKCVTHAAQMYETYYSQGKVPPIKTIITAYKNLGYSDTFIQSFTEKHKKRVQFGKKVGKILDTIFEKSGGTKKKKKEEVKKEEEDDPEEEDEEEEEDGPEEDEALVADDEEEDVEEVIEDDLDLE